MIRNLEFYRDIAHEPGDDTPRLAYADWLQENARHEYEADRAEFIRYQVAAARAPLCELCLNTGHVYKIPALFLSMSDRERSEATKFNCYCEYSDLSTRAKLLALKQHECDRRPWMPEVRGATYRAAASIIWRDEISDLIPFSSVMPTNFEFVRGFPGRLSVSIEAFMMKAGLISRGVPLEEVTFTGRRPILTGSDGWNQAYVGDCHVCPYLGWAWFPYTGTPPGQHVVAFGHDARPDVIPEVLWDLAEELRDADHATTPEQSLKWLSWAAVSYASSQSELPSRKMWIPRPERALWYTKSLGRNQYELLVRECGTARPVGMARVKGDYAFNHEDRMRCRPHGQAGWG